MADDRVKSCGEAAQRGFLAGLQKGRGRKRAFDPQYMRKSYPPPPKKIIALGIRGLFGVISPSKALAYAGDDVQKWWIDIMKYKAWRRTLSKMGWKYLYRQIRAERRGVTP